ncbi:MAG: thiamine phosphate synthase [Gemmatimonadota bacterium]
MTARASRPIDLRLIVITDQRLAAPRTIEWVVAEALAAGAPAVQLRDQQASSAQLFEQALRLRELTQRHHALLFINDRLDIADGVNADGVHLGPDDLPVAAAHAVYAELLLGYSTDSPERARAARTEGAAYIGCGAVFATTSKAEVVNEQIGVDGLRTVVEAVSSPVVAIGGITPLNVQAVADTGAAGCAVIKAIMSAAEPGQVANALLRAFDR